LTFNVSDVSAATGTFFIAMVTCELKLFHGFISQVTTAAGYM